MKEQVNVQGLLTQIGQIDTYGAELSKYLKEIDSEVDGSLQSLSGSIYGDVGNNLANIWTDKCSDLYNYSYMIKDWVEKLSLIAVNSATAADETKTVYGEHVDGKVIAPAAGVGSLAPETNGEGENSGEVNTATGEGETPVTPDEEVVAGDEVVPIVGEEATGESQNSGTDTDISQTEVTTEPVQGTGGGVNEPRPTYVGEGE